MRRLLLPILVGVLFSACSVQTSHKNIHSTQHIAKRSVPVSVSHSQIVASWYGIPFHGRQTANGERYNMHSYTAAHKTLPFGTTVKFTNELTGQTVIVRVTDRGPFIKGRDFDLSFKAAQKVGIVNAGTGQLKAEVLANPLTGTLLAMQDRTSTDAIFAAVAAQNLAPVTAKPAVKIMLVGRKPAPTRILIASKPIKVTTPILLAERDDLIDFAKVSKASQPRKENRFAKVLVSSVKIAMQQSHPRSAKAYQPPTLRRVADSPGMPYYAVDDLPEPALLNFSFNGDEWPDAEEAVANPSPKTRYVGRVQRPNRPLSFGQNSEWPVHRNNGT
jgi:rare lipoprotein A